MNIGIIDIGWRNIERDTLKSQALGGSETWLLSVTNEFARRGHRVDVYCNTKKEWCDGTVMYVPLYNLIDHLCHNKERYDFMILNRIIYRFKTDIISIIRQYNATENIFIQMHDLSLLYEDHLATEEEIMHTGIFDKRVRGIVFLTPWHATNFDAQYPFLHSIPKIIIPNGVDQSLIPQTKENCDNRILWSSCRERGLDILISMYDEIKNVIPDFGIDVAGYNDLSDIDTAGKDIRILGNLSKEDLYKEMNKHKVWFYPGTFAETFCITMVENMLCRNYVVSPFTFGTRHIISGELRDYLEMNHNFNGGPGSAEYALARSEAIARIAEILQRTTLRHEQIIDKCYENAQKYTWEHTVDEYLDTISHIQYTYIPEKNKKHFVGIFMSQSCNHPFFKDESAVVEETWAKDLIDGKYEGYAYFRFTSCDEGHPNPCIDGHVIYVNNDDRFDTTYEKMRDAYRLLLANGYDFETLFRTNTSTYINVRNAIKAMETNSVYEIKSDICGYYHLMPDGHREFQFNCFTGNAYIMSKKLADSIFLSNFDSSINSIRDGDDIICTMIVNELYNPGEIMFTALNQTGDEHLNMSWRYKHLLGDVRDESEIEHYSRFTDDPSVVKDNVSISVRMKTTDMDLRRTHGEFDHIRELHKAYEETL